jgi:iron complex outermembrane receptor protein
LSLKAERLRNDHERSGGLYSFIAAKPNSLGLGVALGRNENYYGTGPGADPFGYAEPDNNPFTGSFDRIGFFDRTVTGVTARYVQKFGEVSLTSITDYQELRKTYGEDTDMSPNPIFNYDTRQRLWQVSQETRLSGIHGRLTWLAGVYGLHITTHNAYQIVSPIGLFPNQNYGGTLDTDSWAAFGQGEYALTDQFTAILGGRYSSDIKTLDYTHLTGGALDFAFNQAIDPRLARQTFDDWSGKAELQYKPARGLLFYASVNRGTKSGGFGTQAFTPIDPATVPFKGETLVNYEGGFKLAVLDRTTNLNASVFHYDYSDYQAFSTVSLSQFVTNHPANVTGVEAEIVTHPLAGLALQLFGTWLDTRVKGIVLPFGDVRDRVLPQAPAASLGLFARYEWQAGPGKLAIQTDWKYDSAQFFSTFNAPIDREGPRAVGNARLSYALDGGHWELAVFANNIADRWYRIYNLDLSVALGDSNQAYARPRWIGGSVTYRIR